MHSEEVHDQVHGALLRNVVVTVGLYEVTDEPMVFSTRKPPQQEK